MGVGNGSRGSGHRRVNTRFARFILYTIREDLYCTRYEKIYTVHDTRRFILYTIQEDVYEIIYTVHDYTIREDLYCTRYEKGKYSPLSRQVKQRFFLLLQIENQLGSDFLQK